MWSTQCFTKLWFFWRGAWGTYSGKWQTVIPEKRCFASHLKVFRQFLHRNNKLCENQEIWTTKHIEAGTRIVQWTFSYSSQACCALQILLKKESPARRHRPWNSDSCQISVWLCSGYFSPTARIARCMVSRSENLFLVGSWTCSRSDLLSFPGGETAAGKQCLEIVVTLQHRELWTLQDVCVNWSWHTCADNDHAGKMKLERTKLVEFRMTWPLWLNVQFKRLLLFDFALQLGVLGRPAAAWWDYVFVLPTANSAFLDRYTTDGDPPPLSFNRRNKLHQTFFFPCLTHLNMLQWSVASSALLLKKSLVRAILDSDLSQNQQGRPGHLSAQF